MLYDFISQQKAFHSSDDDEDIDGDEVDNNCKDDVISNAGATSLENGNIQSQVVEEDVG